jgi:hypothetical protein
MELPSGLDKQVDLKLEVHANNEVGVYHNPSFVLPGGVSPTTIRAIPGGLPQGSRGWRARRGGTSSPSRGSPPSCWPACCCSAPGRGGPSPIGCCASGSPRTR